MSLPRSKGLALRPIATARGKPPAAKSGACGGRLHFNKEVQHARGKPYCFCAGGGGAGAAGRCRDDHLSGGACCETIGAINVPLAR
eukprot:jgi/Chlat1/2235/Chrsp17S02781